MTTTTDDRLALTQVPNALRQAGFKPAPYRRIYHACIDARIPAEQSAIGRWTVARSDLSTIAEALGLERADAPAAS